MKGFTTEAKVGLVVIIGAVVLAYMSMKIGLYRFGKETGYRIFVVFDSAAGLDKKTPIRMAGVEIGKVEQMELFDSKARVTFRISQEVKIHRGGKAMIRSAGLLGEKYVDLVPGKEKDYYHEGDSVPQSEALGDLETLIAKFTDIGSDLKAVTQTLKNSVGTPQGEEDIKSMLANFRNFSQHLDQLVTRNQKAVGDTIDNLKEFSSFMNEDVPALVESLKKVADNLEAGKGTLGKLLKDEQLYEKLTSAVENIQKITQKVGNGEGTIGKLFSDDKAYNNLNSSLEGLSNTLGRIERFKTIIGIRNEYEMDTTQKNKGYFSLSLEPRADKYYLLEVVEDPRGYANLMTQTDTVNGVSTTTQYVSIETKLKVSAEFGRRYDGFDLHFGMVESSFGGGISYNFYNDQIKVGVDIWDFNSSDPQVVRPHLKTTLAYNIIPHLFLQTGYDQILNSQLTTAFIGAGLTIDDEDIKYLLGSAAAAIR